MPVYFTTTVTLPGFCGGRNATTTTSTQHGLTLTLHHTPGKRSPPNISSGGRRYGQPPQLQAINERCKTQKGVEPIISQQIWVIRKRHWRQNKEPHQHHQVFNFNHKVPTERKRNVTYGQFVCTVQPEKAEPNQRCFTVGGDRIK